MSSSGASDADLREPLRIIVGPTAAGKSAIAVQLAEEHGGAIVSADSRQIYRGFDIGTAKPTRAEQARVPHCGIDVAEATDQWSAARFADSAATWIDDAYGRGRVPVVVGGTGFWISALVAPLAPVPDLDVGAQSALRTELAGRSNEELRAWCIELDPDLAHLGPAQWRRAIEVALLTGRRLSEWRRDAPSVPPRAVRYLVVDPGPGLETRIASRVDEMLAQGWVDEVRGLAARVPADALAWKACGYERIRDVVYGADVRAVRDDIMRETRQYARRQRTWFRRQLRHGPVMTLDSARADAMDVARAWWKGADA